MMMSRQYFLLVLIWTIIIYSVCCVLAVSASTSPRKRIANNNGNSNSRRVAAYVKNSKSLVGETYHNNDLDNHNNEGVATQHSEDQKTMDKKVYDSMKWIREFLLNYYESRSTVNNSSSTNDLSEKFEGRQMPTQSSLGDAIAVAGLGLLFINQVAVALNMPFILPFLLLPVALLTLAVKLISNADSNTEMVTQFLRSGWGWNS